MHLLLLLLLLLFVLTRPIVPAMGRITIPPRPPRFRDSAFVTPETDDRVPAEACLNRDDTPRKVARIVEDGPWEHEKRLIDEGGEERRRGLGRHLEMCAKTRDCAQSNLREARIGQRVD